MDFSNSIDALKAWRVTGGDPTAISLFSALCADLSPGKKVPQIRPAATGSNDPIFRPLSHLSWWGGESRAQLMEYVGARTGALLETEYDVAWLDVALSEKAAAARIPDPTLRAFHEHCVRGFGGEDPALVKRLRDDLVLFVTVHGKGMPVPDLYVAGPARDETGTDYLIGVLPVRLSKALAGAAGNLSAAKAYLAPLQGLARGAGPGRWRSLFGTTGEVRDVFRKQMAERLASLMVLLEKTADRRSDDEGLVALREAATLIVFRLMFLMELEGRRGLLYLPECRPSDRLSLFELADLETAQKRKDSLLARLQELTEHIRKGTGGVALSGASIFANAPNEAIDPAVTTWLDDFDRKARKASAELREEWHAVLAKVGGLVTGQVEVYAQGAPMASAVGLGGSEHVQRVLGDVYEQILAMTPRRDRKGALSLAVDKGGGKNERKALAAHYTPEGMVVEIVRPLVGILFRDAWSRSTEEPITYRKELLALHIVDPAMGSAHFLTVVALEIAKELAWAEVFGCPQPEDHFEVLVKADPWSGVAEAERLQQHVRQYLPEVVRRCCFGVDIKPLACELSKLALWLFTMTAEPEERPALTFVDGNVRTGDSLVGVTWVEATKILRERLDWDPARRDTLFGSSLGQLRRELEETSTEMRAAYADLRGWLVAHGDRASVLPPDEHLLRQRGLKRLEAKQEEIRWVYDLAVLAAWYPGGESLLEALRGQAADARLLPEAADRLPWGDLMMGEGIYKVKSRDAARAAVRRLARKHRAFHWELEFPDIMDGRKFDGIVANPPFRGDRDLRGFLGEDGVSYLRDRFTNGDTVDYAGYFVLRYDQLLGARGAFGTLAPNTLAQAKNRRVVLAPLIAGASAGGGGRFRVLRAVRSRPWPGEAAVHVCMAHLVSPAVESPARVVVAVYRDGKVETERVDAVERISAFLDDLPDTESVELPSMSQAVVYNGFFPRGDFDRPLAFASAVPAKERGALRGYLNNDDVQQSIEPHASRVVIDFVEALEAGGVLDAIPREQVGFLRKQFPFLMKEVEHTVGSVRRALPASSRNKKAREYWWRYEDERPGLRRAWASFDSAIMFGEVSKCWVPARIPRQDPVLNIAVNPTHTLFVIPADGNALLAILSSFPFELHLRRSCSTLKADLRVTPSEAFPSFPLPWNATWSAEKRRPVALPAPKSVETLLGKPMEAIAALRTSLLVGKDRSKLPADIQPGGPTDLYNLYDDPSVKVDAIARLRALHVALTDALLLAYGWNEDGPDGPPLRLSWTFDRPWIDGTSRYVPDVAGRRELILRLGKRNADRFREEMELCLKHLLPLLPAKGLADNGIDKWRKDHEVGLNKEELLRMLGHGVGSGRLKVTTAGERSSWHVAR